MNRVLIWAVYRTESWWTEIGRTLGFDEATVLTDKRGRGDRSVTDAFYAAYAGLYADQARASELLTTRQVDDVIARCRVLRWLPRRRATAMALAMAEAMDNALTEVGPTAILSFPIDNYVSDVLDRRARARDIPYFELTTAIVPNLSMFLYRGRLIQRAAEPDPVTVDARTQEIIAPLFRSAYVKGASIFTPLKFLKTYLYFKARGFAFRAYSLLKRDPLNQHYLDAQGFLGHKPRLSDIRIIKLIDQDWRERMAEFAPERRLFIGLQLIPEASIDYWIDDLGLIQHEDLLVDVAKAFSDAGYLILVKDHPLQFGFRQVQLLDRLKALPNVLIVPYEISGNEMVSLVDVCFTSTGALGMQAAMLGKKSIVAAHYYTTPEDYIVYRTREEIADLPRRVAETPTLTPEQLQVRQHRIVSNLLRGCFTGDYHSFTGFRPETPPPSVAELGTNIGLEMKLLGPDAEDWHGRRMDLESRP